MDTKTEPIGQHSLRHRQYHGPGSSGGKGGNNIEHFVIEPARTGEFILTARRNPISQLNALAERFVLESNSPFGPTVTHDGTSAFPAVTGVDGNGVKRLSGRRHGQRNRQQRGSAYRHQ